MLNTAKNFFGSERTDFAQLMKDGAIILDVRSKGEYTAGHINGSINIPIDKLAGNIDRLTNKSQIIITCCASGMRSAAARKFLILSGYTRVYNGGSWNTLNSQIN